MKDQRQAFFDERATGWENACYPERVRSQLTPLVQRFALHPGSDVLDMGTGPGTLLPYLRAALGPGGRLVAFDLSREMVRMAMHKCSSCGASVVQATAMHLPFADARFDAVICFAAFPHFSDKLQVLMEMRRVARPGAPLFIAHLLGRRELMEHHGTHAAVKDDALPDDSVMRRLFQQAGIPDPDIEDRPGCYLAWARVPSRSSVPGARS